MGRFTVALSCPVMGLGLFVEGGGGGGGGGGDDRELVGHPEQLDSRGRDLI